MRIWEVRTNDELRQACGDDALLVWAAQGFAPGVRAWRRGDAVAVASPYLSCRDRLAVHGPARQVAALVRDVLPEVGPTYRPIGDADLVAALPERISDLRLVRTLGWMETASPSRSPSPATPPESARASFVPPAVSPKGPGAAEPDLPRPVAPAGPPVRWLHPREWSLVAELIQEVYPRSYARPGLAGVRRWTGSYDAEGRLAAITADAWTTPGIGYLAGVVTRPAARRRGHGAAAFRLALDTLVKEQGRAGLMVATDNRAARGLYARMGMGWRELGAACVVVRSSAA